MFIQLRFTTILAKALPQAQIQHSYATLAHYGRKKCHNKTFCPAVAELTDDIKSYCFIRSRITFSSLRQVIILISIANTAAAVNIIKIVFQPSELPAI